MEIVIACEVTDCRNNCDRECQHTNPQIIADASYSGAYCASMEIKKAPATLLNKEISTCKSEWKQLK